MDTIRYILSRCPFITIAPGHWTTLQHCFIDGYVYVVYLNRRNGISKVWRLSQDEYRALEPKHGSRDRFVSENFPVFLYHRRFEQLTLF